ncbi:3058_t:CDS:2, partial [Scutellospora calospora]
MSALSLGKRQRESDIIDAPAKKQKVLKSAVRTFDQKTVALGSTRFYKCSNHLQVDSECNESVPRESVYDAEILALFLLRPDNKRADNLYPEVILELQATGSVSTLIEHFNRAIIYADMLQSREIWIVHFSREDSVHDNDFKNVRISARFWNTTGEFREIIDE